MLFTQSSRSPLPPFTPSKLNDTSKLLLKELNSFTANNPNLSILIIGLSNPFCCCISSFETLFVAETFKKHCNDDTLIKDYRDLHCKDDTIVQGNINGNKFYGNGFTLTLPRDSCLNMVTCTPIKHFPLSLLLDEIIFGERAFGDDLQPKFISFIKFCLHHIDRFIKLGKEIINDESNDNRVEDAVLKLQQSSMVLNRISDGIKTNTELIDIILKDQRSLERMIQKTDPNCPYFPHLVCNDDDYNDNN